MTAFSVVRFRVKPGRDQEFLDAHKKVEANWSGLVHANIIKTGGARFALSLNGPTWMRLPTHGQT